MEIGYILVRILPRYEISVYKKLKRLKEVAEVSPIYGDYDFIVKLKIKSYDIIGKFVIEKLRTIDGIKRIKTLSGTKL